MHLKQNKNRNYLNIVTIQLIYHKQLVLYLSFIISLFNLIEIEIIDFQEDFTD
jgi:hypothetical protein